VNKLAILLAVFEWACSPAGSAPVPKELRKPSDSERLLGEWVTTVCEYDGQPKADESWTFRNGLVTGWAYRIAPDESPKHLDLFHRTGGPAFAGIYEFEEDKLKIAYTTWPNRPTEVTTGKWHYVELVRRKDRSSK